MIPCLPATESVARVPLGSTITVASCGHRVWVSPATRRTGLAVVCVDCVRGEQRIVTAQMVERALEAVR